MAASRVFDSLFVCVLTLLSPKYSSPEQSLSHCKPEDFQFSFTECDQQHGRYRVSVPIDPKKCSEAPPSPPIRINSCYTLCESGTFFNSTSLECEKCKLGYYSLGGGIKLFSFDENTLSKHGFSISSTEKSLNCSSWQVKDGRLEYKQTKSDLCYSALAYGVNILKKGKILLQYQFNPPSDPSYHMRFTFIHYNLKDKQIGHLLMDDNSRDLKTTRNGKWRTFSHEILEPGFYSFIWRVSVVRLFWEQKGMRMYDQSRLGPDRTWTDSNVKENVENELGLITIKNIEVYGVSYTSECTPCEPGTYTDSEGSRRCTFCPENTFAQKRGSISCSPCPNSTSFSFMGSDKCLERPDCTVADYFDTITPCDNQSRRRIRSYHWVEPKICIESLIKLPAPVSESCDPTSSLHGDGGSQSSPGMEFINGTCQICPENWFNDGSLPRCQKCPPTTLPRYSLVLSEWKRPISLPCRAFESISFSITCKEEEEQWIHVPASPSYLRSSAMINPDSALILSLQVPGFYVPVGGKLSFRFEIHCDQGDNCGLSLLCIKDTVEDQRFAIQQWDETSVGIREHTMDISDNIPVSFYWRFSRNSTRSYMKIYQISLTNALGSGAVECKPCPINIASECIPCPQGNYISIRNDSEIVVTDGHSHGRGGQEHSTGGHFDENPKRREDSRCMKCPANTILNHTLQFPIGLPKSCIPCSKGLISSPNRTFCYNDCNLSLDDEHFDLSSIAGPLSFKANTVFFEDDNGFFHFFNLSLCGPHGVTCTKNITEEDDIKFDDRIVRSFICQSTIVPAHSISIRSVSLGDELLAVTHETQNGNMSVHSEFNGTRSDLHLYFGTKQTTPSCPEGRSTIITLRCQPDLDIDYKVQAPRSCPDATCDGCSFHFMVMTRTSAACRKCKENDYDIVVTECIGGQQEIHYINARGFILNPDGSTPIRRRACSVVPRSLKVGIVFSSMMGVILLILVVHFWLSKRKLEYKYCKLIENKNTPECCAMDDDEEEEVHIRHHENNLDSSDYETIQLTKHSTDDIL